MIKSVRPDSAPAGVRAIICLVALLQGGLALGRGDADEHRGNDEDRLHRALLHAGVTGQADNARGAKMENEIYERSAQGTARAGRDLEASYSTARKLPDLFLAGDMRSSR